MAVDPTCSHVFFSWVHSIRLSRSAAGAIPSDLFVDKPTLPRFILTMSVLCSDKVAVDWEVIGAKKEREREDELARAGSRPGRGRGPSSGMDREMK